jgi:1-aminocyclopropane-1-carboxylate deaminase
MIENLINQLHLPSPVHSLPLFDSVTIHVKRDDLIHPLISGNKWRKLKYNLEKALASGCDTLLTFGGAFSNHIDAVAAAAQLAGIKSIGIIRGEYIDVNNSTLKQVQSKGMKLIPVPVEEYNQRHNYHYLDQLRLEYPTAYIIPEGGSNYEGVMGTMEIWNEINEAYDYVCCGIGTGTTMAGLVLAKPQATKVIGYSVFKSAEGVKQMIMNSIGLVINNTDILTEYESDFRVAEGFGFGGYAKVNEELKQFARDIYAHHNLPLDLVYTAKAFFGMMHEIKTGKILPGSNILFYHSGGLQGNKGFDFNYTD